MYRDNVHLGNEGVWLALMGKFCESGDGNGESAAYGSGGFGDGSAIQNGVTGSYVTEVLPIGYKKLLRPGSGVGESFPL